MAWTDPPRTWTDSEIVTQTMLNTHVRDQLKELWHEIAYVEFTANVTVTATTAASAIDIVSSGALTYVANPIMIEFYSMHVAQVAAQQIVVNLWDATTDLGMMAKQGNVGTGGGDGPVYVWRRLTPTAASHTYKIKAWSTSGTTGTVQAGAGGIGNNVPGFIRVMQKGGA